MKNFTRHARLQILNGLFWAAAILLSSWLLREQNENFFFGLMTAFIWAQIAISQRIEGRRRRCCPARHSPTATHS